MDTLELINPITAEEIIMKTVSYGDSNTNWNIEGQSIPEKSCNAMTKIFEESASDFNNFETTFLNENEELCNQQKDYLTVVTERKIEGMKNSILQYQGDGEKITTYKVYGNKN